jgi:hypothetical protein
VDDVNPQTHAGAAFNPGMGNLKSGQAAYPTSYFITRVFNQKVNCIFCKTLYKKVQPTTTHAHFIIYEAKS